MLKPIKMYPKSLFKEKRKKHSASRQKTCLPEGPPTSSPQLSSLQLSFPRLSSSLASRFPPRRLPQNEGGAFSL
jgi:hypothetical protein